MGVLDLDVYDLRTLLRSLVIMETYFISMGISVILQMLKNETHRRKYRHAMIKVRNAINTAFADDEDFQ